MANSTAAGPAPSFKAVARTVLEIARTRADLLRVELAQEQARFASLAMFAALAVVAIGVAAQLAAMLAVAWFWDTPYRMVAVAGAVALFVAAAAACVAAFVVKLRAKPAAFESSLRALQDDIEALGRTR